MRALGQAKIAAIGPATTAAVETLGLRVDYVPDHSVAEGVVNEWPASPVCGTVTEKPQP